LTYNYVRIGGVAFDAPPALAEKLTAFLDSFEKLMDEFDNLISFNKIFIDRLANLCAITTEEAIAYGLVGPNLRACGMKWDLRKDQPYAAYPEIEFDVPVGRGEKGSIGDCYDRYIVRIREMRESVKILRQCLKKMPEGPIMGKVPRIIKPPKGETYAAVEAARGELGYFVVSDGTKNAYRVKIRTGSFAGMSMIEKLSQGTMIADLVVLIASLDVVAPEIDR